MANIARLNVDLVARTAAFARGMASARSTLTSFLSPVNAVTAAAGALGVSLSAAAGVAFVKSRMEEIDVLAKTSDSLNATTEGLVAFRHGANLAGVGAEAFDKSLGKMVINVGEAINGSKTAADAFKALGLSTKALQSMTADQQFYAITGAMESIENQTKRVGLAYDIFGRQGIAMLNVMGAGVKGLNEAWDDADKLGLLFSREQAAQVEAANDAMTRVGDAVKGVGNQFAIVLAPRIEAASNMLTDYISEWDNLGPSIENVSKTAVKAFALMGVAAQKGMQIIKSTSKSLSDAAVESNIDYLEKEKARLKKRQKDGESWLGDWIDGFSAGGNKIDIFSFEGGKESLTLTDLETRIESLKGSLKDIRDGSLDFSLMDTISEMLDSDVLATIDTLFSQTQGNIEAARKSVGGFGLSLSDLFDQDLGDDLTKSLERGTAGVTDSLERIAFSGIIDPAIKTLRKERWLFDSASDRVRGNAGATIKISDPQTDRVYNHLSHEATENRRYQAQQLREMQAQTIALKGIWKGVDRSKVAVAG